MVLGLSVLFVATYKKYFPSLFQRIDAIIQRLKVINFFDDSKFLTRSDVLFVCHDVDRPMVVNGRAYSPLIDSVRSEFESLGFVCSSIALPWSKLKRFRAYGAPVSINRSYAIFLFCKGVCSFLKLSNDCKFFNPYEGVMQKTEAKLIISIGSPRYLANAARANQIFHVELLHAFGYSKVEWGWEKFPAADLPQGILSLDEVSTASFSLLREKGIEIKTIPHPFLKKFLTKEKLGILDESNFDFNSDQAFTKIILISLNWGYDGDHGEFHHFSGILKNGLFACELGELIDEFPNILWLIRLHPVQMMGKQYKGARDYINDFVSKRTNCEWRRASQMPFPSVARQCDGTIAMVSSSVYEAATLGVTSLLLCPTLLPGGANQNWYTDLVDEGYVKKIGIDKCSIKKWLFTCSMQKPRLSNLKNNSSWLHALDWMLIRSGLKAKVSFEEKTK
jgi:hypothetical protein